MKITKRQLRRIIKEGVARALHEQNTYTMRGSARGDPPPPSDSNWSDFAAALDIGVLDLDEMAYDLGFSNFHDMDQSISPAVLAERDPQRFAAAAQASSMRAMDMSHSDILDHAAGGW